HPAAAGSAPESPGRRKRSSGRLSRSGRAGQVQSLLRRLRRPSPDDVRMPGLYVVNVGVFHSLLVEQVEAHTIVFLQRRVQALQTCIEIAQTVGVLRARDGESAQEAPNPTQVVRAQVPTAYCGGVPAHCETCANGCHDLAGPRQQRADLLETELGVLRADPGQL